MRVSSLVFDAQLSTRISVYLIPASTAPLKRVCMGADNLLLTYTDSKARLWDTKTLEFWRSMSVDKADEMLDQGEWTEWYAGFRLKQ